MAASSSANNKEDLAQSNILDSIISGLQSSLSAETNFDIIRFIYEILGFDAKLKTGQTLLLKCIYNLPLDNAELLLLEKWQLEGKTNFKDFGPDHQWTEIVVAAGMRAGKSMCAAMISAYEFWLLHAHPNPQKMYGLPTGAPIRITTLATSEAQTLQTIFGQIKSYIERSAYFKALISKGEITILEKRIISNKNNVTILGAHSTSASLVGSTGKLVVYDEISRMAEVLGGNDKVNDLYKSLGRSTATFAKHGKRLAISSVWCEGDYLQVLEDQGWDRAEQGSLVFRLMTKDLHDGYDYEINSFIPGEIEKDPIGARRDYESIRPKTVDSFLDPEEIERAIRGTAVLSSYPVDIKIADQTFIGLDVTTPYPLSWPQQSWIHVDPGVSKDSYGLVAGHAEFIPGIGITAVVDVCLEWAPVSTVDGVKKVSFDDVERVIRMLSKIRNVSRVTSDHFQNQATLQRLMADGIACEELNFKNSFQFHIYTQLRTWLNAGRVILPKEKNEPYPLLIQELRDLVLINGMKIDHPRKTTSGRPGSKDLADGVAVLVHQVAEFERMNMYSNLLEAGADMPNYKSVQMIQTKVDNSNVNPRNVYRGGQVSTTRRNIYGI
jgi:hypothetical protein